MKICRAELIQKVREVIRSQSNDPAKDLRAMGEALIKVADVLEGLSGPDARAVMEAVAITEGVDIR